jgi:hypothetical protein
MVFTANNISVLSWQQVLLVAETGMLEKTTNLSCKSMTNLIT